MNVSHTRPFSALEDRKPRSTTPRQVRAALVAVDYLFETKTQREREGGREGGSEGR